jgi:hypothetical protein
MVKKRTARKAKSLSRKGGSKANEVTNAIIDAAVEIGRAAEALQESIGHFQNAAQKGERAVAPIRKAGKKAVDAVRKISRRK